MPPDQPGLFDTERVFQFSDAKSHKFWAIDLTGDRFTVRFGKVGTAGQTQTKTFATPDLARREADKLVAEKLKKGYGEVTARPAASDAEAFERTLAANPDDLAAWIAYADYLQERGDPRGDFMRVQIALEDPKLGRKERMPLIDTEAELLAAHEADWLGPLAALPAPDPGAAWYNREGVGRAFARGWLARVDFHNLTVDQARALARSPGARLLRALTVDNVESETPAGTAQQYVDSHYEPGPDVPADLDPYDDPGLHALCRCPHLATVRHFRLGRPEDEANCHMRGELAVHLVKQMPRIEELHLLAHRVDANKLFALPMPGLRVLQLDHSDSYPLDKLAANPTLGNLTTLQCWPHAMEYDDADDGAYIRLEHLKAICRSPHLKALAHLRLRLTDFGDKGMAELVESGALKRLRTLDLRGGCVTDDGAAVLAACPDLKNLESLDLSRNAMTAAGARLLEATGVNVDVTEQHSEVPGEGDTPEYLYEGDIE